MRRTDWEELSSSTRKAIEAHTGPARGAVTASAGQGVADARSGLHRRVLPRRAPDPARHTPEQAVACVAPTMAGAAQTSEVVAAM